MNEEKLKILDAQLAVLSLARDIVTKSSLTWSEAFPIYDRLHQEGNRFIDIAFGKTEELINV